MQEMKLKEWQVPIAARQTDVLGRERVLLEAAHTGAGKTYLAAQTIRDLGIPTLVVCPKIARSQWREVLDGMGASKHVLDVINPENLIASRKQQWYSHEDGWRNIPPGPALLVFDEVHRGAGGIYKRVAGSKKGSGCKQSLMLARWVNRSTPGHKVLLMSATPADSPLKMQAIGYLMGFHDYYVGSFYGWCRANGCSFVEKNRAGQMALEFTKNKAKATEIMKAIRAKMGDRFISVGPSEIPGFPEETVETVLVDLAKADHDALVKAYEEMPKNIREIKPGTDEMVKLLRLRQQAEFAKAEAIAQMAVEAVEDGCSVFVCLNFTDARLRVENYLSEHGVRFSNIYGGQNDKERQAGIDAFQDNRVHVMVGMSSACGVALSLHDVKHERPRVSLISPGWSSSELKQALGRIRRVGGTTATQKIVLAAGSTEERVARAVRRKVENLDALVDGDLMR